MEYTREEFYPDLWIREDTHDLCDNVVKTHSDWQKQTGYLTHEHWNMVEVIILCFGNVSSAVYKFISSLTFTYIYIF